MKARCGRTANPARGSPRPSSSTGLRSSPMAHEPRAQARGSAARQRSAAPRAKATSVMLTGPCGRSASSSTKRARSDFCVRWSLVLSIPSSWGDRCCRRWRSRERPHSRAAPIALSVPAARVARSHLRESVAARDDGLADGTRWSFTSCLTGIGARLGCSLRRARFSSRPRPCAPPGGAFTGGGDFEVVSTGVRS